MKLKEYFLSYIVPGVTIALIDLIVVSAANLIMGTFNRPSLSTGLLYSGVAIIAMACLGIIVHTFISDRKPPAPVAPVRTRSKYKKAKPKVDPVTLRKFTNAANRLYALNVATFAGAICVSISMIIK